MAIGRNDEQDSLLANAIPVDQHDKVSPIDIELDEEEVLSIMKLPIPEQLMEKFHSAQKLNVGQRIAGGTVSFLTTMGGMVWGSAIALDENAPELPVPSDYALPAIGAMGAHDAITALRTLSQREHPLDYLFLQGSGSFAKGLAMEAGKKAAAMIPPIMFAVGISYGRDALFNYAMQDPENNMTLMLGLSYFNTPLLRSLLITVPSLLLYWAGQKAIERWVPGMKPPEVPVEENPDTKWYQKLLAEGLDTMNAVTLAGLGRQIFITMGPELVLHSPYALMMAPGFLLLLALMQYYAENPHPFKNVRDFVGEYADMFAASQPPAAEGQQPEVIETEEQSAGRIAANIGIKFGIALSAFAMAALVNRSASAAISSRHPDAGGDNDPSSWMTVERVGYEAALVAGMIAVQKILENLPAAVNKVKQDGPGVVQKMKEDAPVIAHHVSESVSAAAKKAGAGIATAAHKTKAFFGTSVAGFFSRNNRQAEELKAVVKQESNPLGLDGEYDNDEVVTDGYAF